jgi:ankyrin repeat protein
VEGRTALIIAADIGLNDIVDILVIKGNANRKAKDRQGRTALVIAARKRRTSTVNHLLDQDWERY